jgi:urease beta subunit
VGQLPVGDMLTGEVSEKNGDIVWNAAKECKERDVTMTGSRFVNCG